ncbi:MAG: TonB-dependent receptor [Lysobacteraceae bacterium]|nr:MAG: TonB-dependent receptor [Xanthomonadaceae bacterium]
MKPQHKLLALAVFAALSAIPQAYAQETPAAPAADEEPVTLATMTVTAQKREEAMQDVPIMLTALPEQLLQDTGVRDIKDVQLLVPGLHVSSTTNEAQTTARIRGVGTNGDNAGLESAVGVVIDGVYRPRTGVGFGDLGPVERIEVLKGPQGTVFGKNTSAGVINVITRRPSYSQMVEGEVTVGNYGALGVSGSYNDSLSDNAAFSIYAAKRKRDGFNDVHTGEGPRTLEEDNNQNFHSLRGQLLWEPTENLDINFIADFTSREENCCVGVTTVRGPTAAIADALAGGPGMGIIPVADPERRLAYANRSTEQDMKDKGLSAEINWNTPWFNGATFTSITASRDWQSINGLDLDFSGADVLYRRAEFDDSSTAFKSFSQEFRLTGSTDRLDWMVGAFYSDEDLERHDQYVYGSDYEAYISAAALGAIARIVAQGVADGRYPAGSAVDMTNPFSFISQVTGLPQGTNFAGDESDDVYNQSAKSLSFFTNNTFHATDKLDFTVGLRYTREEKELLSSYDNINGAGTACQTAQNNLGGAVGALVGRGVPSAALLDVAPTLLGLMCVPWANFVYDGRQTDQDRTEKEWSGTLKAAYRWNENLMTYVSGARGYKGGGFNLDRVQVPSAGGILGGPPLIVAIDDTSFPGEFVDSYELGAKTTWADGNLLLNATLFHQEYENFQLNSFLGTSYVVRAIPQVISKGVDAEILWQTGVKGLMVQGGVTYADTRYGDDVLPDADLFLLPGSRISFAPAWSGTGSVTYQWDFGSDLIGRFNIGAKYLSEHNTGSDLDPQKIQSGYALVNARVGIGAKDKRWALEFWGQNLTDETYTQVGFDAPLQTGSWNAFLGAPRTYGMTLRLQY